MQTPCAKTTSENSVAKRGLLSLVLGSRSQARGRQGEKASTVVSGGSWNGQEMPTGDKRGVGACEQVLPRLRTLKTSASADRRLLETEPSRPNLWYLFKLLIQEWMSCARLETQVVKLGMVSPQVGVDFGAVSEIMSNRAVNLLKCQGVIVIGDALWRKTAQKIIDN